MGKRMNIALCVGMIENAFSYSIIDGAMMGAKDIDANLFILPVGIIDAQYDKPGANCYRYQYNTLTSVVNAKSIDAVILEYGTITSFLNEQEKIEFLHRFDGIPVMLIAGEQEGYSSVSVDNRTGLEEIFRSLIEDKQCTRIGFVSGPKTSQDALERLDVYRRMVRRYDLGLEEDWIVYGNFSEFSEGVVEELLQKHPDVEAIVCANDQMAFGCYNTLKQHGLIPGKDIYVTGFDNSSTAILLDPHLTSVKADTKELGYLAVKNCERMVKGSIVRDWVPTKMVERQSSGNCMEKDISKKETQPFPITEAYIKKLADLSFEKYFNNFFDSKETRKMRRIQEDFFRYYLHLIDGDGNLILNKDEFLKEYETFGLTYEKGYIELDDFIAVIYMLYHQINDRIRSEEDRFRLVEAITEMNQELIHSVTKKRLADMEKTKLFEVSLTNITRDMLQSSATESGKYESIINKLKVMGFASSYIFSYGKGIIHRREDKWNAKDYVYARGYHNQDQEEFFTGKEKRLSLANLFRTGIMPTNRRVDMLVMPIFSGIEQFGLFFTESDIDYFRYATQIVCQVGVSVEVMEILKKQNGIKKELERNLARMEKSNKVLDVMSHTDSLTGIKNRRGYNVAVNSILQEKDNYGKRAIAVYADMDCLKIVNDEFGHDEGDYALRIIADTLTESFRSSDVVARMGGDEFAAFSLISEENFGGVITERIHNGLKQKNENDKPYYVDISVGTYEFVIDENSVMDDILGYADRALYEEKRNKVKVVYKNKAE